MIASVQFCQEVGIARGLGAYAVALPVGVIAGVALYRALTSLRRSNPIARFVGRVLIISGGLLGFSITMQVIAGPCWLAGRMRNGTYNSSPVDGHELVESSLVLGALGAVLVPFIAKAKGRDVEW